MLGSPTGFDMSQATRVNTVAFAAMISACGDGRDVGMHYDGYEHLLANNIIYDFCPPPPHALERRAFAVHSQGANMR